MHTLAKGDHARRDYGPDSHLQRNCSPPLEPTLPVTIHKHFRTFLAKGQYAAFTVMQRLDTVLRVIMQSSVSARPLATIHKHLRNFLAKDDMQPSRSCINLMLCNKGLCSQPLASRYDSATIHKHCVSSSTCMGGERLGTYSGTSKSPFQLATTFQQNQLYVREGYLELIFQRKGKKTMKHARSLSLSLFQSSREKGDTTNAKRKIIHPSSPPLSSSILINNP